MKGERKYGITVAALMEVWLFVALYLLFEKKQKGLFFFFSKRSEPKKILLSPSPFLHIKGCN